MSSATLGFGTYSVEITLTGLGATSHGAYWAVSLLNLSNNTGTNLFTTPIPAPTLDSTESFTTVLSGTGTFAIGITELATTTSPYNLFSLTSSVTPSPEPATIGLFVGGLAVLGAVRRNRT